MTSDLTRLSQLLDYRFSSQSLFEQALSHRSYSRNHNERLEFLGDAILNCTIAQALYEKFPNAREGQLSRLRAHLVKGDTLADIGREFELGDFLKLGTGELKSGGFRRDSILADTVEALIGAISLDADLPTAQRTLLRWFATRLNSLDLTENIKDSKTRLQELLQAQRLPLPAYEVVSVEGEPHKQHFVVHCSVSSLAQPLSGEGTSRRMAEQNSAQAVLAALGQDA